MICDGWISGTALKCIINVGTIACRRQQAQPTFNGFLRNCSRIPAAAWSITTFV
jgi:hypothetical protein